MISRGDQDVFRLPFDSGTTFSPELVQPNSNSSSGHLPDLEDEVLTRLLPTLVRCFGIIACGYLAGLFRWITGDEIKGLNVFTTQFALPALIVLNLAVIDFANVQWLLVLAVLLAKGLVFLAVILVTLAGQRSVDLARAAMYAIFCTQGNDFGLAYPAVSALYSVHRPLLPNYVYLLAPLSLNVINPLGFLLMELKKVRTLSCNGFQLVKILWGMLRNPSIPATILGVAGNFLFHGDIPELLRQTLQSFASAFSVAVLFLLGLRLSEAGPSFSRSDALTGISLLAVKMLAVPLLVYATIKVVCPEIEAPEDMANYGFFYGLSPTGPIVLLFASHYGVPTKMMASTMMFCTILFAPMMFLTAKAIAMDPFEAMFNTSNLRTLSVCASALGLLASLWMAQSFVRSGKWKRDIYSVAFCLFFAQVVTSLATLLKNSVNLEVEWVVYTILAVLEWGLLASSLLTALLAFVMLMKQRCPEIKGPVLAVPSLIFGFGIPTCAVVILLLVDRHFRHVHTNPTLFTWFFHPYEETLMVPVRGLSVVATVVCLILHQRFQMSPSCSCSDLLAPKPVSEVACTTLVPEEPKPAVIEVQLEERSPPGAKDKEKLQGWVLPVVFRLSETDNDPTENATCTLQLPAGASQFRISMCLLFLTVVTSVGFAYSLGTLLLWRQSGMFVVVEYMYSLLTYSQGVFVFVAFGIKAKRLSWRSWFRHFTRKEKLSDEHLSSAEMMDEQTRSTCYQFIAQHYDEFRNHLSKNKKRKIRNGKPTFQGRELVDWLVNEGLARGRHSAVQYAKNLRSGRVLQQLGQSKELYDCSEKYTLTSLNWVP